MVRAMANARLGAGQLPFTGIQSWSGMIIVALDGFGDLGTFPVGMTLFPRVGPHDLGIQIDILGAFLLCQGTLGVAL